MKTTFPDELIQFVDRDPAVHAAYWAVRNGVALDKALIDLAVCQTRRCEELTKTAIEAVTRHSRPMLADTGAMPENYGEESRRPIDQFGK